MKNINRLQIRIVLLVLISSLAFETYARAQSEWNREHPGMGSSLSNQLVLPDFVLLAEKLAPMVVNISTTLSRNEGSFGKEDALRDFWRRFFGDDLPEDFGQAGLGSGFIIDRDGTILTNNHVIENAQKIVVKLADDRQFIAKVVGVDEKTDLAVIKIDATDDLPVAPLGDSDRLKVGEWVLAMGSPFGLENTVTAGIVSAKGRQIGAGPYEDLIQTDASINPGNSGGPMINSHGEVVGINTVIFSRFGGNIGIGFAIPINVARELLPELKGKGRVTRGWLGVGGQNVTPGIAEALGIQAGCGVLVSLVMAGSPAERAGIRVRDVIVEYDGKPTKDSSSLSLMVARTHAGSEITIKIIRNSAELPLTVSIQELSDEQSARWMPERERDFGLTVQNVTPDIAQSLGLKRTEGVVITTVERGSAADDAGLRRSDVLLDIDGKTIRNLSDYRLAITGLKKGKASLFLVQRGQITSFIALRVPMDSAAEASKIQPSN